ncbi:MAG: HAD-IIB family hydrolase [Prolixibacteraceae bacterium]|jgi:Cof subfamily protein (haloacid dehalogenase superfamily)|nr:HAD-IIB family hydrolase [Prolixibacteraceae bacterium]
MVKNYPIQIIAVDLDGTLLNNKKLISDTDLNTLKQLSEKRIIRVIATGRSLHKVKEVLSEKLPIDYVVFSSGAGIYDWKNKKLLQHESFSSSTTQELLNHLLEGDYNFFIYKAIPNNNLFFYHYGAENCSEFNNYLERHKGDYLPLVNNKTFADTGQILVVIKNSETLFERLKNEILLASKNIRVIRSTSPVNEEYIWLEIFPDTVSKGHGIKWLCDYLKISSENTIGIGNDYNDVDMFDFVAQPFVLSNGIELLKDKYKTVSASNENSGFSSVVKLLIDGFQ